MPNPYFLAFELVEAAILVLCLLHARRVGLTAVVQLFAGVAYGLLLELATIRQLHIYQYGQFALMVSDVPLSIGVMWGTVLYGVRLLSNATTLPVWARPVLEALLAIHVDLIMDPIAVQLGMWVWGPGAPAQYFGIPYANYWGWFWAAFSFSAGLRLLEHRPGWIGRWLAPGSAILIGVLGVVSANAVMVWWVPDGLRTITVAALLIGGLAFVAILRPRLLHPPDALAGQVTLITQGFFLAVGLISGALFRPPLLLAVCLFALGVSFLVYRVWGLSRSVR